MSGMWYRDVLAWPFVTPVWPPDVDTLDDTIATLSSLHSRITNVTAALQSSVSVVTMQWQGPAATQHAADVVDLTGNLTKGLADVAAALAGLRHGAATAAGHVTAEKRNYENARATLKGLGL